MPENFKKYGVIDYANSKYRSFTNDIKLFYLSKFSIITASGLYWIPFFLNKKFLYINGWEFSKNLGHKNSLQWPSIIKSKNGLLKLNKQKKIYLDSLNLNHSAIPINETIKNINQKELLSSFRELEKNRKLFKRYSRNYLDLFIVENKNNFPNYFCKKFKKLINV